MRHDDVRRAWIVFPTLGSASEVWIARQLRTFKSIRPTAVYWEEMNPAWYRIDGIERIRVPFPTRPHEGPGRWVYRMRQAHRRNFYGSVGAEFRFFLRLCREQRPDVVMTHFGHVGLRMLPVCRRRRIPLVVHFHGLDLSSSLRIRWYRWSLRRAIPQLAAAIVVGTRQRAILEDLGMPAERIHLIPCGVPVEEFTPRPTARSGDTVRFICIGRLVSFKGIRESIEAFRIAKQSLRDAELVVVGDGPDIEAVRTLVRDAGLDDAVRFTGPLPAEQVRMELLKADVLLQHSLDDANGWFEGFGVTVAEAAATGLPVIASRCGGLLDQVIDGDTGFLVDQRDVTAMAEAMLKVGCDPDLRVRMGAAGRERAVAHYDTADQVAKLEGVLLAAANESP